LNILVIQMARMGDIIQSIPLVNDVKKHYPESNIFLLVNEVFHDCGFLLKDVSFIPISLGFFIQKKEMKDILPLPISGISFDIVINLNNSTYAKQILDYVVAEKKMGFGVSDRHSFEWAMYVTSFLKTRHLNSLNLVDIFRRFFSVFYSANEGFELENNIMINLAPKKNIAIQCGARNIKRQFSKDNYIDIATHYLEKGYQVNLLGVQNETQTAKEIVKKIGHKNLIDMTGKTDIKKLIHIVYSCERVYTPDTGTMHLCAFCNTPFTALFYGPAFPFETMGYFKMADVYMPDREIFSCYPCKDDELCPNNFSCHSFSFQSLYLNKTNNNFIKLCVDRDQIGQVLTPMNEMATLWRNFTKMYFFNIDIFDLQKKHVITQPETRAIIQRELKLWSKIDIKNLEVARINFYFLKPLIYFNKLSNEKTLIHKSLEFFKSYI